MLVPYKQTPAGLSPLQKTFKKRLSSSRRIVENNFADVKNRTRRCQNIDVSIDHAVNIVVTSCVIHNICIRNGDLNQNLHDNEPLHCNVNPSLTANNDNNPAGNAKRQNPSSSKPPSACPSNQCRCRVMQTVLNRMQNSDN
ncbi:hypothetical protein OUZ56_011280 [Daphnia magna]|uniref:DDE Tnp4 domain-containing protein n=1 Tax=Daphnia magna TaxID=35525 RepID=A0ABQ9YZU1_9CRUS|nr:hypothetical protein OUZ56_011280 [Daphnia magna]